MVTVKGENGARGGLFLNDSIHWVVYNVEISKYVIVALGLKEMKISEIARPDDSDIEFDLLVVGGLISAWMKDVDTVKIWVMQKYAVQSSWTKIIEFSVDPVLNDSLFIVCVTNFGDIIGKDGEGRLVKFNDRGEFLERPFCHDNCSESSEFVAYTESLFSLPDTSQV
ncbi:uncharacterized protein LOC131621998 [Vicia villosa]|uniref:uncharacterized protein LOC131621998 n=1 Tax=Vicia villosa TaxID=3911 RepID=UPI00273CD954|nr:uncharacterized protein LOC131621998 [Vicia villosa]